MQRLAVVSLYLLCGRLEHFSNLLYHICPTEENQITTIIQSKLLKDSHLLLTTVKRCF